MSDVPRAILLREVLQNAQRYASSDFDRISHFGIHSESLVQTNRADSFYALTETPCAKPSVAEPAVEKPAAEIERNAPVRRFEEDSEDELGSRLRRDALERIATSERVRELLRDSRIRAVVRAIDAAQDGSRALELAREDPEFRAFTETLLDELN